MSILEIQTFFSEVYIIFQVKLIRFFLLRSFLRVVLSCFLICRWHYRRIYLTQRQRSNSTPNCSLIMDYWPFIYILFSTLNMYFEILRVQKAHKLWPFHVKYESLKILQFIDVASAESITILVAIDKPSKKLREILQSNKNTH